MYYYPNLLLLLLPPYTTTTIYFFFMYFSRLVHSQMIYYFIYSYSIQSYTHSLLVKTTLTNTPPSHYSRLSTSIFLFMVQSLKNKIAIHPHTNLELYYQR